MRFYHLLLGVRAHLQTAKLLLTPSSARQFPHPGMQGQSVQNPHYLSTQDVSPNTGPGWGGKKKKDWLDLLWNPLLFRRLAPGRTAEALQQHHETHAGRLLSISSSPLLRHCSKPSKKLLTSWLSLFVLCGEGARHFTTANEQGSNLKSKTQTHKPTPRSTECLLLKLRDWF